MQNLLRFILRYGNFLVFILLEVAALFLVIRYNAYPRSSVVTTANGVVAWQYELESEIVGFFRLRGVNERLAAENARLRTQIERLQDTAAVYPLHYGEARVVQMTKDAHRNFLTIDRGAEEGVCNGMGVISNEGAVGIVCTVGTHYSVVLPLVNTQANLSCRFKKNDYIATLRWDGYDTRYALLDDVATHLSVNTGDTIITSGLSTGFPFGIPVGVVEECTLETGASSYTIKVRLMTDFRRLRYVEVIANPAAEEIEQLTM